MLRTVLTPAARPPAHASLPGGQGSNEITRIGLASIAGNATVESSSAYIKQPNHTLAQLRRTVFDQYEVGRGEHLQRRLSCAPGKVPVARQPSSGGSSHGAPLLAGLLGPGPNPIVAPQVSFPLAVAADCWGAVLETAYGADLLGKDPAAR